MRGGPLAGALLLVVACAGPAPAPTPPAAPGASEGLRISVLALGPAAATFVQGPGGVTVLVDGGSLAAGSAVLPALLEAAGALPPDHVVVTRRDPDRLGGLVFLIAGRDGLPATGDDLRPAGVLLDPGPEHACAALECRAWASVAERHAVTARPGDAIDLGGGARLSVTGSGPASWLALEVALGAFRYRLGAPPTGTGAAAVQVPTTPAWREAPAAPADFAVVELDGDACLPAWLAGWAPLFATGPQAAGCPRAPPSLRAGDGRVDVTTDGREVGVQPARLDGTPLGPPAVYRVAGDP